MLQLADDVQDQYPLGSHILWNFMYVDDALAGAHDVTAAIRAQNELIATVKSAGFSLRKWTSNCKQILANLPSDYVLNSDFLEFENSSLTKLLGIR